MPTNEEMEKRLNAYAMLGRIAGEHYKQQGIDISQIFDKCIDNNKDIEDPMLRFQKSISDFQSTMLKQMPLENRCIFVLNIINKQVKDLKTFDESTVNWVKVNEILFKDPLKYDYNLYESVNTIAELSYLLQSIQQADIFGNLTWYKQKCKDCGEDFYLTKSEIKFYIDKDLHIPKRCKNCIIESKGKESLRQRFKREEKERENIRKQFLPDSGKTTAQIAFEKAINEKKKKG